MLIEFLKRQLSPTLSLATNTGIAPPNAGKLADMGFVSICWTFGAPIALTSAKKLR
jgi:hypothetical protein